MAYLLILFPLAMAAVAFVLPSERWRPWLLPLGGLGILALVLPAVFQGPDQDPVSGLDGWLLLDPLGKVVLGFLSVLFFLCSLYAPGYLAFRRDRPNRVFCTNLFASFAVMTLVALSYHLGLMWVAMEATTLVTSPSIYFNHNARSLEATWKYLLIGSVGIALALLGSFFLAYSALKAGLETTLLFDQLVADAPYLSPPWLHAAFILLFVGYGTKMDWCRCTPGTRRLRRSAGDRWHDAGRRRDQLRFSAILRVYQICHAGPEARFASQVMISMGLVSMAVAAVFMVRQRDFKRMLAYSSIEHMGILVLGVGIGGMATYGALLHVINNGLTKGVLFLSAGNIHRAFGSKFTDEAQGALKRVPLSGALFLVGFLAIAGSPPFGPFVSEFLIASAAFERGQFLAGGLYLLFLGVVFVGMGSTVLTVVLGNPPPHIKPTGFHDSLSTGGPILLFAALALLMGLYIPAPLEALLAAAAAQLNLSP